MRVLFLALLTALPVCAESLSVTIMYGKGKPEKTAVATYTPGMSALDALKQVSTVETSKTGRFLFVRSIDGVRSNVGEYGWFFLIDGQKAGMTAEHYRLKDAQTMTWYYGVEACY